MQAVKGDTQVCYFIVLSNRLCGWCMESLAEVLCELHQSGRCASYKDTHSYCHHCCSMWWK